VSDIYKNTMCDFNALNDSEKQHYHDRLLVAADAFGGKNFFLQLLEAVRKTKPHPLTAKQHSIVFSRGTVVWDKVIFKGLVLKGIYGREMFETWYKMTQMIRAGLDIAPVITHKFHYTDFKKGFETMLSGQSGKVVLDWDNG